MPLHLQVLDLINPFSSSSHTPLGQQSYYPCFAHKETEVSKVRQFAQGDRVHIGGRIHIQTGWL